MKFIFDNIIFSLQKAGGASVVWRQIYQRMLSEPNLYLKFYEYASTYNNIFRKELDIPDECIIPLDDKFLNIKRFLNLNPKEKDKHIFHSSLYRISHNPNSINVTTIHDFTCELYQKGVRKKIVSWQKFNSIQKSQGLICISQNTKKDLLNFLPNIEEEKIKVIYNGVDSRFVQMKAEKYKLKLPFDDFEYVLYVGDRKSKYKNFDVVVSVCSKLKIPLIIVGGGKLDNSEILHLEGKLKNTYLKFDTIDVSTLNEIYNRALTLLYPSAYEGFGIPVIEAQKSGCPAIVYKNSSVGEIVGESDLALNDISENSISEVLCYLRNNMLFRNEIIEQGLVNSKRFSWDNTYKEMMDFYYELYSKY